MESFITIKYCQVRFKVDCRSFCNFQENAFLFIVGSVELKIVKKLKNVRGYDKLFLILSVHLTFCYLPLGLRIIVKGKATCSYLAPTPLSNVGMFYGKEKIIKSEWFLLGSKDGKAFDVPVGVYSYKFSQLLPPQIPYSVKSDYGEISYNIIAKLDIDWARDLKAKEPFVVTRDEDLNVFPELRMPHEVEKFKTFCCFPCRSKPLTIYLTIPRTGFALGEEIPVEIQLINRSATSVKQTMLVLKRLERYTTDTPHDNLRKVSKDIAKTTSRGVKAGEITSFMMNLKVPRSALQSNDLYCDIYQITYKLKFKALIKGFNFSPKISVPITIGSIGIRG